MGGEEFEGRCEVKMIQPLLPQSRDIYLLLCELTRAAKCANPDSATEIADDAILRFFAFDNSLVKAIERLPKRSGAK